ncbi:MAG: hypothetical protein RTU92_10320 [Candidatus Thorarchaeota archaeon]
MGAAKKLLIILLIYFIAGLGISYMLSAGMLDSLGSTNEYIALIFFPAVWIWNNFLAGLLSMPIAYALPF